MPVFRVEFEFAEGQNGWSEVYYRETGTATEAGGFPDSFWSGFFSPRGTNVVCYCVRTSDTTAPRLGRVFRLSKTRSNTVGSEVFNWSNDNPGSGMQLEMRDNGGRRTYRTVRGMLDTRYTLTSGGTFLPTPPQLTFALRYVGAVVSAGLGVQHRAAWMGGAVKHLVTLTAGPDGRHSTIMETLEANAFVGGDRIVFRRLPFRWFPGLRNIVEIAAQIDANHYLLPVRWTGPITVVDATRTQARLVAPTFSPYASGELIDFRTHRTGRPPGGHRGRSSGVHYR